MQDRKVAAGGHVAQPGPELRQGLRRHLPDQQDKTLDHVWATSWGVSTRLIGALIMAHSDDKGLVLPPRLAPMEVVIVPIFKNDTKDAVIAFARKLRDSLQAGFRVLLDEDDQNTPGWKFSEYELQGIPLRVEIGPRDMEKGQCVAVRRDTGEKVFLPVAEAATRLRALLDDIQKSLFQRALEFRKAHTFRVKDYEEFKKLLDEPGGFIEAGWCGDAACEAKVKEETKATIRLIPLDGTTVSTAPKAAHASSAERPPVTSRYSAAPTRTAPGAAALRPALRSRAAPGPAQPALRPALRGGGSRGRPPHRSVRAGPHSCEPGSRPTAAALPGTSLHRPCSSP